jgi:hypothetical protein
MAVNSATHPLTTTSWPTSRRSIIARAARYLGAVAVLAIGIDHIGQYAVDNYSTVPTIGTLFLLNFIASVIVTIGLIAPLDPIARQYSDAVRALFAIGGIALGVLSLAGLFVSETTGLFGFVEHGYRMAIVVAIVVEVAAALLLAVFLVANGTDSKPRSVGSRLGRPAQ